MSPVAVTTHRLGMYRWGCVALVVVVAGCSAPVYESTPPDVVASALSAAGPRSLDYAKVWTVVFDTNVPSWRADVVRSALAEWQTAAPCGVSFVVTTGATLPDVLGVWPAPGTIEVRMEAELEDGKSTGIGFWYPNGGSRITFQIGASDADFPRVARHELGHAFHLPHNDAAPSLMSGTTDTCRTIQPADVATYAAVWCPN